MTSTELPVPWMPTQLGHFKAMKLACHNVHELRLFSGDLWRKFPQHYGTRCKTKFIYLFVSNVVLKAFIHTVRTTNYFIRA